MRWVGLAVGHGSMRNRDEVAIVGYAARLPGARDVDAFWSLLTSNRSAISWITPDRFPYEAFYHPSRTQSGRSYTFAAGLIDDIWGFDAAAFGMSPREAVQVDPQQRHLLEVTYDALAHAGIRPSSLAGGDTGVYVGASSVDYGARFFADPPAADVHMMTGNTLSIVANRLSYNLDLRGPSLTIDTACSSSLVALDAAAEAIRGGVVETAIVAGVNLLLSPFSFVGFSRASMLSPTGRCRPFDAEADGYVRAEGAIVLVLRSVNAARKSRNRIHASIVGSGVGQDGRTTGLSLPSAESQRRLLEKVYGDFGLDPSDLAFVEAHGTGTRAGDPLEADALGKALAQLRARPLPIGSVKSNIGHLEPASGLAGTLKAILALNHATLPATLHQHAPSPDIPFDELNLKVVDRNWRMRESSCGSLAGVNSFGFGGTNAHVVLRGEDTAVSTLARRETRSAPLFLTAHAAEALPELGKAYLEHWPSEARNASEFARAAAHLRDALPHRVIVRGDTAEEIRGALGRFVRGEAVADVLTGHALGNDLPVAFLFAGNGSQWAGMGRSAWAANRTFQDALGDLDTHFRRRIDWSIVDLLFDEHVAAKLPLATFAQPLLFALQAATVRSLEELGVVPTATLGHSVGEIAAAWAAGALSLDSAIDIVVARSRHQEVTRGTGGMAALLLGERDALHFLDTVHARQVRIAAVNSWRSVTVAGPVAAIDQVVARAAERKIGARRLDLDYPFHHPLVDAVRGPLLRELEHLHPLPPRRRFVSSVTGAIADRETLGPGHWWRNVREPVRFEAGLNCLLSDGLRVFVEISPRSILASYVRDTFRDTNTHGVVVESLGEKDGPTDPLRDCAARVLLAGGRVDHMRYFGPAPTLAVPQPAYPWRHVRFTVQATAEAQTTFSPPAHPLLGTRLRDDCSEWFSVVDPVLVSWLDDHRVGGVSVFPAAAYVEVMIAAAREAYGGTTFELRDLDIRRPLVFDGTKSAETLLRLAPETGIVEFLSRPRGRASEWALVARGVAVRTPTLVPDRDTRAAGGGTVVIAKSRVYQLSRDLGFDYGEAFQRVRHVSFPAKDVAIAVLDAPVDGRFVGHIADVTGLDAAFHALFASEEAGVSVGPLTRMLPIRFGRLRVYAPGATATQAVARTIRRTATSVVADIKLLDEAGSVVLLAQDVRFVEAPVASAADARSFLYTDTYRWLDRPGRASSVDGPPLERVASAADGDSPGASAPSSSVLIEAACLRMAWSASGPGAIAAPSDLPPSPASQEGDKPPWLPFLRSALLWYLDAKGLASHDHVRATPMPTCDLPDVGAIVRSLLELDPTMTAEAAMLSRLGEILPDLLAGCDAAHDEFASTRWRELSMSCRQMRRIDGAVLAAAASILERVDRKRLLRVLVLGADHAPGAKSLFGQFAHVEFVVSDRDQERLEKARALLGEDHARVRFASWSELATFEPATVDLALAIDALSEVAASREGLAPIVRLLRPAALIIAGEPAPGLFWDMIRGAHPDWWARSASTDFPVGALLTRGEWIDELASAGFAAVRAEPIDGSEDLGFVLRAAAQRQPIPIVSGSPETRHLTWDGDDAPTAARLKAAVGRRLSAFADDPPATADQASPLVLTIDGRVEGSAADWLAARLDDIAGRCGFLAATSRSLRVVVVCADASDGDPLSQPMWCAVTAALRVVANEYPSLDVRCLGLAQDSGEADIETAVDELLEPTAERTVFFAAGKRLVARLERDVPDAVGSRSDERGPATRIVAKRGAKRGLLKWATDERAAPGPGEIEIEVRATGLNFRDVMWNLGLLPEEALEDGFAGPTLGMECSGVVIAVGADVGDFAVADRVIAFASGAFASHVVVPARAAIRLTREMSFEAAATLPVAFLTAYYSLVHLGRLGAGETVLVHGGAGAVGLAALQIAKHRGAKVIATAGNEDKRALLRNLGADLVLDSRGLAFADEVLKWTESGVDVVLNSLAGEAMVRSIDCLKPFGRFIELGKRDYYGNTHVGLRPFRRNLTYFGVDVDQLIGGDDALLRRLLGDIAALLDDKVLSPLPFRLFPSEAIRDAFRHMQHSAHIGKIVVTNPSSREIESGRRAGRFEADPRGTHVVIGGVGGFGLATADWLAERGARHLLLVSRSGTPPQVAAETIAALRRAGVEVEIAAVDVADEMALSRGLRAANAKRPIRGIVHAAMALDDRLIDSMDRQALDTVLAPKIGGAVNLERLAGDLRLDYLLLYSSATTLMGNPGQFNYVAANAYLEGLARRARKAGLPALAIAWGGISDVGYLSRHIDRNAGLKHRFAGSLIGAREALDALDWAFDGERRPRTACLAIARIDWASAWRDLGALRTPTFDAIVSFGDSRRSRDSAATLDALRAMSLPDATERILETIVEEIAGVLRLPPREIDRHRPLADIGMDSLMMLELRLKVETTLRIDLPMMSLANGISAADVARRIATIVVDGEKRDALSGPLAALSGSHMGAEAAAVGEREREAAIRAVVERSSALKGPL